MKKTRIISLLLALLLLISTAAIFASCSQKEGDVKWTKKALEVDLADYKVVYAESSGNSRIYKTAIANFASALSEKTGEGFVAKPEASTTSGPEDFEVLIGLTSREESKKAYNAISGDGWTIQVTDKKVAIVGTNALLTMQALQFFEEKYLGEETAEEAAADKESASILKLHKKVSANRLDMYTVANAEESTFTYVYSAEINDKPEYGGPNDPDNYLYNLYTKSTERPKVDYPYTATQSVITKIADAVGLNSQKDFASKIDSEEKDGAEFVVGITTREATKNALAELNGGEYAFCVKDGEFVLTAWNDASLMSAVKDFEDLVSEATFQKDDTSYVAFPEGFKITGTSDEDWITEFPKPAGEGIELYNTLDVTSNSLQYLYMGTGINAAAYDTYFGQLKSAGYTVVQETVIEESKFATLMSKEGDHTLYVAYNAYAHASEYNHTHKDRHGNDINAYAYDKCIRVVSTPTDTVPIKEDKGVYAPFTPQKYTKVTNTAVTAIELRSDSIGMGYIITLEDGSFVLIDGGTTGSSLEEHTVIYNILSARHKQIYGTDPSSANPIRIAAWIITHSHGDHFRVFQQFMKTYGVNDTLRMDYLIGNFPSESGIYPSYNEDIGFMGWDSTMIALHEAMRDKGDFTFLKAHTGQKYYFANLEMEILMTYDDHNPYRVRNQNDTSTVTRFSMQATNEHGAKVGNPYTMIWTGDANMMQSHYLCAMWGDHLKADMVQVAHHGNIGSEDDLYNTVNASVVWFANCLETFKSYLKPSNTSWYAKVDQNLVYKNTNTKYVIVSGSKADENRPEGASVHLTLPFGADGLPAFDKVFNTCDVTKKLKLDLSNLTEVISPSSALMQNYDSATYYNQIVH